MSKTLVEIEDNSTVLELAIGGVPDTTVEINSQTISVLEFGLTELNADIIKVSRIGAPTYDTMQEILNFRGVGLLQGCAITSNGDGTCAIASGSGLIRATDDETATLLSFDIIALASLALTDSQINYIYVEYNSGAPQFVATTAVRADHHTNVSLGNVYREGLTLHINSGRAYNVANDAPHIIERLLATEPMEHESGAIISELGTRNIAITSGAFWEGLNRLTTSAIDTSVADDFSYFYMDGVGGWTEVTAQTQIDNLQYDDGSGTLATLGNNRYGVHWVYIGTDSDVYILYGEGSYIKADAEEAQPDGFPPHIQAHGRLIGKIIIQKSSATFESIGSAFDTLFSSAGITSHLNLTAIGTNTHAQLDTFIALGHLQTDGLNQMLGVIDTNVGTFNSGVVDSATAIAFDFDTTNQMNSTAANNGALLADFKNQGTSVFQLDLNHRFKRYGRVVLPDNEGTLNNFYFGYSPVDISYAGMFNDHGDFWLGISTDPTTYINFYSGTFVSIGNSDNYQSVVHYISSTGITYNWSGIGNTATLKPDGGDLQWALSPGDGIQLIDDSPLKMGTAKDATILYDQTNLLVDPKAVGSGYCGVLGDLRADTFRPNSQPAALTAALTQITQVDPDIDDFIMRLAEPAYRVDLSTGYSDDSSISFNSENTDPRAVVLSYDGTKAFMVGRTAPAKIFQYSLTEAFVLSSMSYDSVSLDISTEDTDPRAIAIKENGKRVFILGAANQKVYEYILTTPYDLSTASYASRSLDVSVETTTPRAMCVSHQGDKVYVSDNTGDTVYQYSLTTNWQAAGSYDSKSFDSSLLDATVQGLHMDYDGKKVYILGATGEEIHQVKLTTAFDISTAVDESTLADIAAIVTVPYDMHVRHFADRSKFYILDSDKDVSRITFAHSVAGMASADEMGTLIKLVENVERRQIELESKLQTIDLIA